MIAHLSGKVIDQDDQSLVVLVSGVGYEVFVSARNLTLIQNQKENVELFVYTHYKSDGAALFGFLSKVEKLLFLALIKVDSVGPKTALNVLSAAPSEELIELIEQGDVAGLAALPKISKKMAEHVVVKLKGKLSALLLEPVDAGVGGIGAVSVRKSKALETQKMRREAQSVLADLGYKPFESERVLTELSEDHWSRGLEEVVKAALGQLGRSI